MAQNDVFPLGESRPARSVRRLNLPAEFVVDPQKELIVVRFRGRVTVEDIQRYVRRLLAHPSFRADFSEIVDLTEVEELDLQADELLRLADEIDPFSDGSRRAFVVHSTVQSYAARMHKALRNKENIGIFGSFADAERWISG